MANPINTTSHVDMSSSGNMTSGAMELIDRRKRVKTHQGTRKRINTQMGHFASQNHNIVNNANNSLDDFHRDNTQPEFIKSQFKNNVSFTEAKQNNKTIIYEVGSGVSRSYKRKFIDKPVRRIHTMKTNSIEDNIQIQDQSIKQPQNGPVLYF